MGRVKKQVFDAPMSEVEAILKEYEVPSPSELGKAGSYIQTTARARQNAKREKNDIVLIPIGTTENHGDHANSGLDNFMVTQICEAVRRYTAKKGHEVNLAAPPLNYGGHPYHHLGMPGTIMVAQEVVVETLIYVMLGLWNPCRTPLKKFAAGPPPRSFSHNNARIHSSILKALCESQILLGCAHDGVITDKRCYLIVEM